MGQPSTMLLSPSQTKDSRPTYPLSLRLGMGRNCNLSGQAVQGTKERETTSNDIEEAKLQSKEVQLTSETRKPNHERQTKEIILQSLCK
eukprot:877762-Amphidinium_carterae.1